MKTLLILTILSITLGGKPMSSFNKTYDSFVRSGNEFFSKEDRDLLAEVMYHENFCNGDYIMMLTGSVVLNRVASPWYPDDIRSVLYQKGQYATVHKFFTKPIPDHVYLLAERLLIFGSIAPSNVVFQSMYPNLGTVWYMENGEYFSY